MANPCLSCGACCGYFRASFHWLETAPLAGGVTPAELTARISPHHVAMLGTERSPPRCVALVGEIGTAVHCSIYERRASPCREFEASWVGGLRNERCDAARAAHGLPPLEPEAHAPSLPAVETSLVVEAACASAGVAAEAGGTGCVSAASTHRSRFGGADRPLGRRFCDTLDGTGDFGGEFTPPV